MKKGKRTLLEATPGWKNSRDFQCWKHSLLLLEVREAAQILSPVPVGLHTAENPLLGLTWISQKGEHHVPSQQDRTMPGTAHSSAQRMSSRGEQLGFCSEDFDHFPNGSGFEKFPIIPYSAQSKLKLLSLHENKAVNMLMSFLTFLSHFMPLNRKPCESCYENYQQRLNSLPSYTKTWRAEFIPS